MRVLAPPPPAPPMKAPHLWSPAAERDKQVGTMSLPGLPSHGAVWVAAHHALSPPRRGGPSEA